MNCNPKNWLKVSYLPNVVFDLTLQENNFPIIFALKPDVKPHKACEVRKQLMRENFQCAASVDHIQDHKIMTIDKHKMKLNNDK